MKGYRIALLLSTLFIFGCNKASDKIEKKVVSSQTQPREEIPDFPVSLKYPNADLIDISAENSADELIQFYVFRTSDSLPAVKKFYDERVKDMFQDVECSSSVSERVIVSSYRKMKEEEKANEGVHCILVKEKEGTLGTLIYWQRQGTKTEL